MTPRKATPPPRPRVAAHLSALVLAACAVELVLESLIRTSALRDASLPLGARAGLAGASLVALVPAVVSLAAVVWAVGGIADRFTSVPVRAALMSVAGAFTWAAVLLYGASWTAFWNAGVFLDRAAFRFWLPQPVQVFHWIYPPLVGFVLLLSMVGAAMFHRGIPALVNRSSASTHRRLELFAAAAIAAALIVAWIAGRTYDGRPDDPAAPRSAFAVARDTQSGPALHAIADLRQPDVAPAPPPAVDLRGDARIVRRPIVSMDQYLAGADRARVKRYNVVMIQIESLRSDQLRAYGGAREVMPAIDALARESRVFTNAHVQASHSNYEDLVPLASQYPLRSSSAYEYPENPPYPRVLIYDILKALGYKTAVFSSQNERWGGMVNFHRLSSLDRFFDAEAFNGPTYAPFGDTGFAEWVKQTRAAGSVDDRYTVDETIRWVEAVRDQPFFIHMNLQSSHVPYVVPDGFARPFGPATIDFAIMWGKFPLDKIEIVRNRYADSLFYEDMQIARVFDALKRAGLWDRTIVVVGGDNGEAFYEHGFTSHASSLFNEVMKVPMLVRVPGLVAGADDRPAMFLDAPPTVLDALGLPPHPGFQGVSLLAPAVDPDRSLYMIAQTPLASQSAIVRSGFKLIFSTTERAYFMYDLTRDPGEHDNLAPRDITHLQDLSGRLRRWVTEQLAYYGDPARQQREYAPVIEE